MKILAVHSIWEDPNKMSAVDLWRIYRPLEELKKHVDWQIDYAPTFIPNIEKYKDKEEFTEEELEKAAKLLGEYDIIYSSYYPNATAYSLLKVVEKRYGTKYILDTDDNMFSINPDNPFWLKVDDEKTYWMQCMLRDNKWITVTTEELADEFRQRREQPKDSVMVLPNYISDDYKHPDFDNGDKIVIGYFGGSSHYADLHYSGVLPAIQKIMHENKNVHYKSVGVPADYYIPRGRYEEVDGQRGTLWTDKLFPTLKFDISIAPLLDNTFNRGKSDIKWQESTRAGACFVASKIGPYCTLKDDTAILCKNDEDSWYNALKSMLDTRKRQQMIKSAQKELSNRTIEKNWLKYKEMFEDVYAQQ